MLSSKCSSTSLWIFPAVVNSIPVLSIFSPHNTSTISNSNYFVRFSLPSAPASLAYYRSPLRAQPTRHARVHTRFVCERNKLQAQKREGILTNKKIYLLTSRPRFFSPHLVMAIYIRVSRNSDLQREYK